MDFEPNIKYFFESLGYKAEKIEQSEEESPDFLVTDNSSAYLVELKTKFIAQEKSSERDRALLNGEVHGIQEPIIRKNRFSGIIKKAQSQLDTHASGSEIYRIVWLLSTGFLAEPNMDQFEATLYGSTTVCDWSDEGKCKVCYFFYNSDFFRFKDTLDAAFVSTEQEAKLLLNPLSPRYESMKSCSLVEKVGKAVVDPPVEEKEGFAFYVDGDVDRNDKNAVLKYLRKKYNAEKLLNITMNYLSGTVLVPDKKTNK